MTIWCATCGHLWDMPGPAETIVWPRCGLDNFAHAAPPKEAPAGHEVPPANIASSTSGLQAGDQWSNISLLLEPS